MSKAPSKPASLNQYRVYTSMGKLSIGIAEGCCPYGLGEPRLVSLASSKLSPHNIIPPFVPVHLGLI